MLVELLLLHRDIALKYHIPLSFSFKDKKRRKKGIEVSSQNARLSKSMDEL
jgi:hypothetical protein